MWDMPWLQGLMGNEIPSLPLPGAVPPMPLPQFGPQVPDGFAAFDPVTGGVGPNDYGSGPNVPQTAGLPTGGLTAGVLPSAGNFGGSPANNPNLKPIGTPPASAGASLANALRGMTVPKPPEPQRVATPAVRQPHTAIKSGELLALLEMLQGGSGGLPKLPGTLGAALGGR